MKTMLKLNHKRYISCENLIAFSENSLMCEYKLLNKLKAKTTSKSEFRNNFANVIFLDVKVLIVLKENEPTPQI